MACAEPFFKTLYRLNDSLIHREKLAGELSIIEIVVVVIVVSCSPVVSNLEPYISQSLSLFLFSQFVHLNDVSYVFQFDSKSSSICNLRESLNFITMVLCFGTLCHLWQIMLNLFKNNDLCDHLNLSLTGISRK